MKPEKLFPELDERGNIKGLCDLFGGNASRVIVDGETVYERNSYRQHKTQNKSKRGFFKKLDR